MAAGQQEASDRDGGCEGLPTGAVLSLEESDLGDGSAWALESSGGTGTRSLGMGYVLKIVVLWVSSFPLTSLCFLNCKRRIKTKPTSHG